MSDDLTRPLGADVPSRPVTGSQTGPHDRLEEIVRRHLAAPSRRPLPDHARDIFAAISKRVAIAERVALLFDWGCGRGDSTRALAERYADHFVIGVDKSAHRLGKAPDALPNNALLVRADAEDIARLAVEAGWKAERQSFLFPNPWPKPGHLQRRWHGMAAFADFAALAGELELRTNWPIYAEEFAAAVRLSGGVAQLSPYAPETPFLTLFERKYALSGQALVKVTGTFATPR